MSIPEEGMELRNWELPTSDYHGRDRYKLINSGSVTQADQPSSVGLSPRRLGGCLGCDWTATHQGTVGDD